MGGRVAVLFGGAVSPWGIYNSDCFSFICSIKVLSKTLHLLFCVYLVVNSHSPGPRMAAGMRGHANTCHFFDNLLP